MFVCGPVDIGGNSVSHPSQVPARFSSYWVRSSLDTDIATVVLRAEGDPDWRLELGPLAGFNSPASLVVFMQRRTYFFSLTFNNFTIKNEARTPETCD